MDGLLKQADEIDQQQKYLPQQAAAESSRRLGRCCHNLVALSESLALINNQIKERDVRGSADTLVKCCRIAAHARRELGAVRNAGGIEDSRMSDL